MIPIIGITAEVDDEKDIRLKNTYVHAVEASGGLPVVLPYTNDMKIIERYALMCDGFLFTGGDDIEPSRYGEETLDTCGTIQLFRDDFEFNMLSRALGASKPILAICRGCQVVNVAFGGTLYQDIPSEKPSHVCHKQSDFGSAPIHSVRLAEVSLLCDPSQACDPTGQETIQVNSLHHQAVKRLGDRLEIMAEAEDGIIEAFCLRGEQYLRAFQWHPERMFDTDPNSRLIFADFINACKR